MPNLKDFIVRALEWEARKQTSTEVEESAVEGSNVIEKKSNGTTVRAWLVNDDATQCISNAFLNKMSGYSGASVIFVDIPKVI